MCGSVFMPHPSISLSPQVQAVPDVDIYHNEKGCLVSVYVRFFAYMCVTCAVMNKDVLCVELVVNHWQCWQLTDKQIDPRPPRERRLAPAHSSHTHTHTCISGTACTVQNTGRSMNTGSSLATHVCITQRLRSENKQ